MTFKNSALETLTQTSHVFSKLITRIGQDDFYEQLQQSLFALMPVDEFIAIEFKPEPCILKIDSGYNREGMGRLNSNSFDSDGKKYVDAAYLLDPYYRAFRDSQFTGFAHLNQLAPVGFKDSEYYHNYYSKIGISEECGFVFNTGENTCFHVALSRRQDKSPFSRSGIELLRATSDIFEALVIQHHKILTPENEQETNLNRQLEQALFGFGSSILTPRELDIVHMLLKGHSTQSTAEKLGISKETVKIHRRNSYQKLDISSQSELFNLFISALIEIDVFRGGDPLDGFL